MPNTREKLIELLTQVAVLGDYLDIQKVADHLIANGVTIPVRCKNCISGHEQYYGNLLRCNVMGCAGMKPDDFCSYGERRNDG